MDKADKLYKFISERPDLFADGHAVHTPRALVEEILDKIQLDGSILVMFNIEFVISIVYNYNIDPDNITFYSDSDNKSKFANKIGVKYINTLETDMKFDVVIGNPPYNKGILKSGKFTANTSGYPHLAFTNMSIDLLNPCGIVSMVMPASFMTLTSCDTWRKDILKEGSIDQIMLLDNRKNQIFDIEHTWICNVILKKSANYSTTEYLVISGDSQGSISVDLTKYTYIDGENTVTTWPMFYNHITQSIYEKVRNKSIPMLREGGGMKKENYNHIGYVLQGVKDRPVVNDTPKDKNGVNPVKAPGYVLFNSQKEAENYCQFMKSKLYKLLINVTKCISKTQPQSIVQIGNFDFSSIDPSKNSEIYKFFSLSKEEMDYIDAY